MNDIILKLIQVIRSIHEQEEKQQKVSEGILANLDALLRKLKIAARPGGPKDIGFFGAMSRGKSSLINELLGRDLMPVASGQTTSVVIKVRHKERQAGEPCYKITIVEKGGKRESFEASTPEDAQNILQVFGARKGNGGDAVDHIEVDGAFPDSKILKIGGVLVDTPGAEAAFEQDSHVQNGIEQKRAEKILENTDVILFVEGANYMGSANSSEFFKSKLDTFKPLIVVNKKDEFVPEMQDAQNASEEMIELAKINQIKNQVLTIYHSNVSVCVSCKDAKEARKKGNENLLYRSRMPDLESLICNTFEKLKPENIALLVMEELDDIIGQVDDKRNFFRPARQQFFNISQGASDANVMRKADEMYHKYI